MNLRFTSQTTLTTTATSLQPSKMSTKLTLLSHKYDLQMDFEEASGRAYELGWWDGIGSELGEFGGVDLEKILRLNLTVGSVQRRRRIPVQGIDHEEKTALWNPRIRARWWETQLVAHIDLSTRCRLNHGTSFVTWHKMWSEQLTRELPGPLDMARPWSLET